jgi:hypothetical protein
MVEIVIEYDKWKNEATVNGEDYGEGLKVALHQELEWKGKTFIIVHVEDEVWKHRARGLEKEGYKKSLYRTVQ